MKILHTADWHLGKKLERFCRLEEQREVLEEICTIAKEQSIDAILLAGDIFDTFNPSTEVSELLFKTLKRLSRSGECPIIAIAGNHDSPERINMPDVLARECGIFFIGYPNDKIEPICLESGVEIINSDNGFIELKLPKYNYPLRVLTTPYANEQRIKTVLNPEEGEDALRNYLQKHWINLADAYCDNKGVNMLITHLFMMKKGTEVPEEPEDEKPIHIGGAQVIFTECIPPQIQYTALGHLHRLQTIDKRVVYSGSPLSYSFAEAGQPKYTVMIYAEPAQEANIEKVLLTSGRPLERKRFDTIDEAESWLKDNPYALVELTIVNDISLSAKDTKRLYQAHSGIISIIPEITNQGKDAEETEKTIDLTLNINTLFAQYFKSKNKGQEPNQELFNLFKELQSQKHN